jgi:hypothetical protein
MPVDNLVRNWAYMVVASLAWNLKASFAMMVRCKDRQAELHGVSALPACDDLQQAQAYRPFPHLPTWIMDSDCRIPKTFRSHRTTTMTTTTFRIDFMDPAIGMKRLISQSSTPTTIRTTTT